MSFGFYRSALVRSLFLLVSLALLGGCAGYAIDYVKPKGEIVGAELTRYGLDAAQSACVNERLGAALNPWQLRQLQKAASGVTRGYADPGRLQMSDLLWVSRHVDDPKVALELGVAANACGLGAANVATARIPATAAPVGTGIVAAAPSNAPVVTLPPAPGGPAPGSISAPPRPGRRSRSTPPASTAPARRSRRPGSGSPTRARPAPAKAPICCASTAPAAPSTRWRSASTMPPARSPSSATMARAGRAPCRSRRAR
jgi:hypothetical protein